MNSEFLMNPEFRDCVAGALRKAKCLIEDPEHWTRNVMARDKNGHAVDVGEQCGDPVSWCAYGALEQMEYDMMCDARSDDMDSVEDVSDGAICVMYDTLRGELGYEDGLAEYNDSKTHSEVLELFDRAIDSAKSYPF